MTLAEARLERAKLNLAKAGTPGNKGGGNTPNYLRKEHQEAHAGLLDILIVHLEAGTEPPHWVSKNLDVTGKYGLGEKKLDISEVETVAEINRFTAAWFSTEGMAEKYDEWVSGLKRHFQDLEGR